MKTITFRPTPDAMKALAILMNEWDCNRSQAVNMALVNAVLDPGPEELETRAMVDEATHERLSALAQEWGCTRTAVIERLIDHAELVWAECESYPASPAKPISQDERNEIVTALAKDKIAGMRAEREKRLDAAQRKMAQAKKGKSK